MFAVQTQAPTGFDLTMLDLPTGGGIPLQQTWLRFYAPDGALVPTCAEAGAPLSRRSVHARRSWQPRSAATARVQRIQGQALRCCVL